MTEEILSPMTRRSLIGSAIVGGLVLAGCGGGGSSSSGTSSTAAAATGTPKRGGTFRFGPSDFSGVTTADPQAPGGSSFNLAAAITDGLVERDHKWQIRNALAEEFTPNKDFTVWTVRLKPGLEFVNGKTVEADDVIYSIKRNVNPKAPGFTASLMQSIDTKKMKARDPRTVEIPLLYPNSQLLDAFAEIPSSILPVGFNPQNPIGTGPFKQKSFAPQQQWVGDRFENYWRKGQPYLDQLILIGFSNPDVARLNGLITGQLDGIDHISFTQVQQLESRSDMQVIVSETGAFEQVGMDTGKGYPFADKRVLEAFKLMVDREQMVASVYNGLGGLGNDTGGWPEFDKTYPSDIPQREQDLEKAKSLFKAAGMEGETIGIRCAENVPGQIPAAELIAQYGQEAGVNVQLDKVTDLAQWYSSEDYYTSQVKIDYDYTQSIYDNMTYCWTYGGTFNSTGYHNPKLESLFKQALATSGEKYNELAGEMARMVYDEGPWLVWGRRNIPDAYTSKFTGAQPDASGTGFNGFKWYEIGLAE